MRRLLLLATVALLLLPAGAFAAPPSTKRLAAPPPAGILGEWEVSSYGLVEVRAVGSQYRGTVTEPVTGAVCLTPGRETWQIAR